MANNEAATEPRGRGRPVVPEEELIAKIREASLSLLLSCLLYTSDAADE